jgi:hypothetical protein
MDPLIATLGVAVPAILAGVVLLAVRRSWSGALALGLAVLAGALVVLGVPAFPPKEPHYWFGFLSLAAALGAIERPAPVKWGLAVLLSVGASLAVLHYVPAERLERFTPWLAAYALGVFVVRAALEPLARRKEGLAIPLALWIVASGGAVATAMAGFIGGGQVGGMVAAGLGALAFFAWWRPVEGRNAAAVPVVATVLPAIWLDGYWMAELTPTAGLLLAGAPLGAWAGALPPLAKRPRLAVLASCAGVAIPVAIAVALSLPAPEPGY